MLLYGNRHKHSSTSASAGTRGTSTTRSTTVNKMYFHLNYGVQQMNTVAHAAERADREHPRAWQRRRDKPHTHINAPHCTRRKMSQSFGGFIPNQTFAMYWYSRTRVRTSCRVLLGQCPPPPASLYHAQYIAPIDRRILSAFSLMLERTT